jgi:hypothetical protein
MSLPSGFQENDIMAANTEETVQETIGHSSFMPTYGLPAHLSRVALVAVFGAVLFPLLRSAQGFTLFGQGCFFAFERLARPAGHGSRRSNQFPRRKRERMMASHRPAHRHLPLRCARVALPATKAAEGERETL